MIFVGLTILATFWVAKYGIWMCEDVRAAKHVMGGFLLVYAILGVALKLVLPAFPADRVAFSSVTDMWTEPVSDFASSIELPAVIETVFASDEL